MVKKDVFHPEIKLVGIKTRTNNEFEKKNVYEGRCFALIKKFVHEKLADKIQHRTKPATLYCCYTNYESDHTGDYDYFIGEAVDSFDDVLADFETLIIPAGNYLKITNGPAAMPNVISDVWNFVWQMKDSDFSAPRSYDVDFEVYDERAKDHQAIILDVFIGLKK